METKGRFETIKVTWFLKEHSNRSSGVKSLTNFKVDHDKFIEKTVFSSCTETVSNILDTVFSFQMSPCKFNIHRSLIQINAAS